MEKKKPSEIIKEHIEKELAKSPMPSCGIPPVDLLAKHVAKLAVHADAVDAYLDTLSEYLNSLPKHHSF